MRVSVTEIDAYRRWKADEEAELEPLLRQLRKLDAPSEQMLAGSALHKALELATDGALFKVEQDGFKFVFDMNEEIALPVMREIKAEKVYMVGGQPVTLVGKVDALHGKRVEDHKTTGRFDAERFMDSYQWRAYLSIFAADVFQWNVFEMGEQTEPRLYRVFAFHQFRQYRYAAMESDLMQALADFVGFASVYLPERIAVAA